jgi:hypothetical protein
MLRHVSFRRAVVFTLIPTALNAVVFALPVASGEAIAGLTARLSTAGFPFRGDAIALFTARAGGYDDVSSVVREVRPVAIALAAAFAGLWLCERGTWLRRRDLQHPALLAIASCVAIAAPFVAAYGGWDRHRWLFLIECNFVVVVWLALHYRAHSALATRSLAVLAAALLALSHVHLMYFDDLAPRLLSRHDILKFIGSIKDRSLFVVADVASRWTP